MNFLKKQGTAWVIAGIMIVIAIIIGSGKSGSKPSPMPEPPVSSIEPIGDDSFVRDLAGVLTAGEKRKLDDRNQKLLDDLNVVVACVTVNYGGRDLGDYALRYAEELNLDLYDFIVVLDISGENYWLLQGAGLLDLFSDSDCEYYANKYMEKDFAKGDYGKALLSLVDALSNWYYENA